MQSYQHLYLAIREIVYNNQVDIMNYDQNNRAKVSKSRKISNLFIGTWKDWFIFREISAEQGRVGSSANDVHVQNLQMKNKRNKSVNNA